MSYLFLEISTHPPRNKMRPPCGLLFPGLELPQRQAVLLLVLVLELALDLALLGLLVGILHAALARDFCGRGQALALRDLFVHELDQHVLVLELVSFDAFVQVAVPLFCEF